MVEQDIGKCLEELDESSAALSIEELSRATGVIIFFLFFAKIEIVHISAAQGSIGTLNLRPEITPRAPMEGLIEAIGAR